MRARTDTQSFMNAVQFFRREFDIDIEATYQRIKTVGKLDKNQLKDRMALSAAINEAGENSMLANRIWLKAKKERELFRLKFASEKHKLSQVAIARVEAYLDSIGSRRKQITAKEVDDEIAAHDDTRVVYERLIEEQEEYREIVGNLKHLADQWADRKGTLQSQAKLLASQREVVLGGRE